MNINANQKYFILMDQETCISLSMYKNISNYCVIILLKLPLIFLLTIIFPLGPL